MIQRRKTVSIISVLMLVASLALLGVVVFDSSSTRVTRRSVRKLESRVTARICKLESYVEDNTIGIPEDMVIYRYSRDSLFSWDNRFPLTNDDISRPVLVNGSDHSGKRFVPPLSELGDSLMFRRFGRKWYLLGKMVDETRTTVYGLEIMNQWNRGASNGVNARLRLSDRLEIKPLDSEDGETVSVRGVPQFKLSVSSAAGSVAENAPLVWTVVALLIMGILLLLSAHRSVRNMLIAVSGVVATMTLLYFWGRTSGSEMQVFSPIVYAASDFLYSLGPILLINCTVLAVTIGLYLVRDSLKVPAAASITAGLGILTYSFFMLRSIMMNSAVCLELYKLDELSPLTAVVYLSFLTLLLCVPLLLKMSFPNVNSRLGRVIYSVAVGAFILSVTSVLGFNREKDRLELWATRLAVDRNINLELQLKRCEADIAADQMIASASRLPGAGQALGTYVIEHYLSRIAQDYDIGVFAMRDIDKDPDAADIFDRSVAGAEPIAEGSRFLYLSTGDGRIRYTGVFMYYDEQIGLTRVLLGIESKSNHEEKGYNSILGFAAPGQVLIPSTYSYAKYSGRQLQFSKGNYAYPTGLNDNAFRKIYLEGNNDFAQGGYTHFVCQVADEEAVVVSRPSFSVFYYLVDAVFIALLMYIMISLCASRPAGTPEGKNYYRRRISWILMISLTVTLVSLVLVSVLFVYRRNDANKQTMMSDRINAIHSFVEGELRRMPQGEDGFEAQDVMSVIKGVARVTGTDITLYDPSGRVMLSTVPEIYSRLLLAGRIDMEAYDNIAGQHKRFFIHRESLGPKMFYSMYAPLYNADGKLQAIICAPYTDESYDFEKDAVMHSITIVVVFLILLLIARVISSTVVDRLFKPLSEMGLKMKDADLDRLEHISYDRDDELSTLVSAYNRMVDDLTLSSQQLAQAERDKA